MSNETTELLKTSKKVLEKNPSEILDELNKESPPVTKELLIAGLGKVYELAITDDVVNIINSEPDSTSRDIFRDNILTFREVLEGSNISVKQYFNAVKFVTFRTQGSDKLNAYTRTFPERFQKTLTKYGSSLGKTYLHSYATSFNKSKAVIKVMEKALIPDHILYADIRHKAFKTLANLAVYDKSSHVRVKACDSILTHSKKEEEVNSNLDPSSTKYDPIELVSVAIVSLAKKQQKAIRDGMPILEASDVIVDSEDSEDSE